LDNLRKNKDDIRNSRMFLLENKLQSFYEEIKKLNDVTFKIKDEEENQKFLEKINMLKNNSLNTNTYGLTDGDTNIISEKSNANNLQIDSGKNENKKIEINKIIIQNPNKSKIFNGKNENEYNNKKDFINAHNKTIVKCNNDKKKFDINNKINISVKEGNINDKSYMNEDEEKISDYDLVLLILLYFLLNFIYIRIS